MKRAVIFDLDGLLIDSEVVSHQLMDELLRQYGYSLTKAEYARIYSGKTGIGNMTHMIETYHLPLTVAEGMAWEARRGGAAGVAEGTRRDGRAGNIQQA